jgi:hypothetical protein
MSRISRDFWIPFWLAVLVVGLVSALVEVFS